MFLEILRDERSAKDFYKVCQILKDHSVTSVKELGMKMEDRAKNKGILMQ